MGSRPNCFKRIVSALPFYGLASFVACALMISPRVSADEADARTSVTTGNTRSVKPSTPASVRKDWRKDTEANCGISCRYSRANDNLTLQAVYLIQKIKRVDDAISEGEEVKARTALGGFCRNKSEAIGSCFTRYKAFQRVGLLEIRQAIGKNEDTIARLTHARKEDGKVDGDALVYEIGGKERDAYVPEVTTLSELEASYLSGNLKPTGSKYSATEIRSWSQTLVMNNPLERTIEFRKESVEGNPYQTEKTAYRLYMTKKDGNGKDATDAAAAALYKGSQKQIGDYVKDQQISGATAIAPSQLEKKDKLSYDSITEARSLLNSRIDGDLKKDSDPVVQRKIAADPKADPSAKPSPRPSSLPESAQSREVRVGERRPSSGYRPYGDEEKVVPPEALKNSRYIRYNIQEMFQDIQDTTK